MARTKPLETQIKLLTPDDWPTYRDVRLRSLMIDSECLGRKYEQEAGGTKAQWRGFLEEHTTLVAVVDGAPIGVIAISRSTYSGAAAIINVWRDPKLRGQ